MITIEDIRAAQDNDLAATAKVLKATEEKVSSLAEAAARRMGYGQADYREEFHQTGRIAVWEALKRFQGGTVDDFLGYVYVTVERTMLDALRSSKSPGADADALKVFAAMLPIAGGDMYLAERICQTLPAKGHRLSADRAYAARAAWQGTVSIHAPAPGSPENTARVDDLLESEYGVPDAMLTPKYIAEAGGRAKRALVHAVLDSIPERQAYVLRASYGIDPVPMYGVGRGGHHDGELAADMGLTVKQVADARTRGYASFGKRWSALMGWDE